MIYAVSTEFGSELLTKAIQLYCFLYRKRGDFRISASIDFFNIKEIKKKKFTPILIGIDKIPTEYLRTEFGEPTEKLLAELEEKKPIYGYKVAAKEAQLSNFELLHPIPLHKLTFYEVLYTGSIGNQFILL